MPYIVQEILTDVSKALYDEDGTIWYNGDDEGAQSELLAHLNSSIVDIVTLDPSAKTFNGVFVAVAGPKQTLPSDAVAFLDLPYNLDSTGLVVGRSIRKTTIGSMEAYRPNWSASPPSAVTRNVAVDPEEPRTFYCWPPCLVGSKKQIKYSQVPADLTALTDVYPLPDMYKDSSYAFILWRALMRKDENGNPTLAEMWRNTYLQTMGQAFAAPGKLRVGAPETTSTQNNVQS